MERIILTIIIIFLFVVKFNAQTSSFYYFDSLSYRYFKNNNHDSLIEITNKAIEMGYDCYYFRLRRGISYFNNKQYKNAITELKNSLKFNSCDPLSLEYLYMSHIYEKNYRNAYILTKYMSKEFLEKNKIKKMPLIEYVGLFYLKSFNNLSPYIPKNIKPFPLYVINDYLTGFNHLEANLEINLYKISILSACKFTQLNFTQDLQIKENLINTNKYEGHENSLYNKLNLFFKNKKISIVYFYSSSNINKNLYEIQNISNSNVTYFIKDTNILVTNYGSALEYNVNDIKTNFIFSTGFSEVNNNFSIFFEPSYSYKINKKGNLWANSSLLLYLKTDTIYPYISFEQTFFLRIYNNIDISIFGRIGKLNNIGTNTLYYIYSYPYTVKSYIGGQVNILLIKHLNFYIKYVLFNNVYTNFILKKDYNFAENILNIGCIWKF